MKTIQKILPIAAISILALLIVVGLFFKGSLKAKTHEHLIPSNASSVAFINPEKIEIDFYNLLKRDPTLLDSVSNTKIDLKEIKDKGNNPGINPFTDLIAFTFYDPSTNHEILGAIVEVIDETQFINFLTKIPETISRSNYSTGEIIDIEKGKIFILKNTDETYILLHTTDKDNAISIEAAQAEFDLIFNKSQPTLIESNASFKQFVETDKHAGIWSNNNGKIKEQLTSLFSIFGDFNETSLSFNSKKEKIEIQSIIDLNSTDFYVKSIEEELTLNEHEIVKFSLSTTPKYLNNILEKVIGKDQRFILDYCTGSICGGMIGYKETPVFTTQIEEVIDPETFETVEKLKKVDASPRLNIPELMYVLKIRDQNQLFNLLNSDSTITIQAGYWTIPHPFFIDENIYITLKDKLLYIGTNKEFEFINPQFSTLGFTANIPKAIDNYPPKNAFQKLGKSALPEIKVSTINISFDKIEKNQMILNGAIVMTDTTQHSMLILTGEVLKYRGLLKGFI